MTRVRLWCRLGLHDWGAVVRGDRLVAICVECGEPDPILQAALDQQQGPT